MKMVTSETVKPINTRLSTLTATSVLIDSSGIRLLVKDWRIVSNLPIALGWLVGGLIDRDGGKNDYAYGCENGQAIENLGLSLGFHAGYVVRRCMVRRWWGWLRIRSRRWIVILSRILLIRAICLYWIEASPPLCLIADWLSRKRLASCCLKLHLMRVSYAGFTIGPFHSKIIGIEREWVFMV